MSIIGLKCTKSTSLWFCKFLFTFDEIVISACFVGQFKNDNTIRLWKKYEWSGEWFIVQKTKNLWNVACAIVTGG